MSLQKYLCIYCFPRTYLAMSCSAHFFLILYIHSALDIMYCTDGTYKIYCMEPTSPLYIVCWVSGLTPYGPIHDQWWWWRWCSQVFTAMEYTYSICADCRQSKYCIHNRRIINVFLADDEATWTWWLRIYFSLITI